MAVLDRERARDADGLAAEVERAGRAADAARAARRVLTRDAARLARDIERRFGS